MTKLQNYLNDQQAWMEEQVSHNMADPYWRNVALILSQYKGLQAGYNHAAPKDMVRV